MRRGTGKPGERRRRDRIRVRRLIKRMSDEGRDAEPGETKRMRKRGVEPWVRETPARQGFKAGIGRYLSSRTREIPARQGQSHFLIERKGGGGTCLRFNDHIIPVAHLPPPTSSDEAAERSSRRGGSERSDERGTGRGERPGVAARKERIERSG